jgi:alkylhydroperoxidase family enzyme
MKRIKNSEKVDALENWRNSELFSPDESAALDYAEQMTDSKQQVTDSCFEELKANFDESAIVELTALISFQTKRLGLPPSMAFSEGLHNLTVPRYML